MYNLIEYSDNYSRTLGSSWQFKRDEVPANNADLSVDNSWSFKYKSALVGKMADAVNNKNSSEKNTKIVVPLKYLSNFWSLEMPLISKIYHELNWIEDCILSSNRKIEKEKFKIMDAKLHFPIVTLSTKD